MPRPTRLQWIVIWLSVITAAHVWMGLRFSDFWPGIYDRWGLPGYLYYASIHHRSELATTVIVIGALLVWQYRVGH